MLFDLEQHYAIGVNLVRSDGELAALIGLIAVKTAEGGPGAVGGCCDGRIYAALAGSAPRRHAARRRD